MKYYEDTRSGALIQTPSTEGFDITHMRKIWWQTYHSLIRSKIATEEGYIHRKYTNHTESNIKDEERILNKMEKKRVSSLRYYHLNKDRVNFNRRMRHAVDKLRDK